MSDPTAEDGSAPVDPARLAAAADWFCQLHAEEARVDDLSGFRAWLESDGRNALAYRIICATWSDFERYASRPQMLAARRAALGPRRGHGLARLPQRLGALHLLGTGPGQWGFMAAAFVLTVGLAVLAVSYWTGSADIYRTGAHERRTLTLDDGSEVTLDTSSRLRVRFLKTQRLITLEQGQACFQVAKDPSRPFRIQVRRDTIIALGTELNVDMIDRGVTIALLHGHVMVLNGASPRGPPAQMELRTGEALRVRHDGSMTLLPRINVDHLVAWLSGHLAFDGEPLGRAAERVSHYSQQHIEVAPSLDRIGISGVFNIGDADAFVEAVTAYFPVKAVHTDASTVLLTPSAPQGSG